MTFSQNYEFISCNYDFFSRNYDFFLRIVRYKLPILRTYQSLFPPRPSKLDFNSQLRVYITQLWEKSQNCEIKSRNNLFFLFFIQWWKRASIESKQAKQPFLNLLRLLLVIVLMIFIQLYFISISVLLILVLKCILFKFIAKATFLSSFFLIFFIFLCLSFYVFISALLKKVFFKC